jgi:hypothetical protein
MDNLIWHGGLMLKRFIEQSGRSPTVKNYAVALILAARDECGGCDLDLEQLSSVLEAAAGYDAAANKLDKDARIRQLGF